MLKGNQKVWVKFLSPKLKMVSLTSWIPVYITILLHLHIWKARVYASGTSEEDGVESDGKMERREATLPKAENTNDL
ncbi:putative uncharacterized protein C10orf128 homolog isoform X5 [Alligator sinensis]|uniref:Uncharacterized protein n=1 Tax=Alligator sinensis TaxID=38654 RepID=A0A3Q0HE60_ALLSI|nr:putative uncharacterized protein C10orf128 homolog isoform X5 [Alligator sinensis]